MEYKFAVAKIEDIDNLLPADQVQKFYGLLNMINAARAQQGKTYNSYIVINLDESYAGDVVEIMKANGHWDDGNPIVLKRGHSIKELVKEAHDTAVSKGWWDSAPSFGEIIALIHSEASEALEDYRIGSLPSEAWYEKKMEGGQTVRISPPSTGPAWKPCGIPSELADIVIRVMDACGHYGIDLEQAIAEKMAYNATRPQRHGGKVL
ncbi:hypothetical protein NYE78_06475 [Paenibacillus sp. FSL L8-0506]|uniref:hypothetical protein n=2 Tax=Paenibacillus sp. FSL L8-0506 TaxID=2975335 RepID=UPI0030F96B26